MALKEKITILSDVLQIIGGDPLTVISSQIDLLTELSSHADLKKLIDLARHRCIQILAEHRAYLVLEAQDRLDAIPSGGTLPFQASTEIFYPWQVSCEDIHRQRLEGDQCHAWETDGAGGRPQDVRMSACAHVRTCGCRRVRMNQASFNCPKAASLASGR